MTTRKHRLHYVVSDASGQRRHHTARGATRDFGRAWREGRGATLQRSNNPSVSGNASHSVDVVGVTVFAALGLFVWLSTVARRGAR